ncbi:glycoside hydrolase [Fomitiporia mediterranea MF3/22]|uniref:glycoside hydrolase n=1 Tax=Fomitiporia mediterranea (strain MF3/22) TaxID=694068 RepID=UPI0004408733|nr:glycoside hydrolase [Fomitiporia mediterranea MF3/22]EJC98279.1 glycoside hydrolase [Fomitiporia mediterranea MF3/22]
MDFLSGKAQEKWNEVRNKFHKQRDDRSHGLPDIDGPITVQDVYRYRRQRGVNLGSWFTLERWISDAPFRCAQHPAVSDYDVARGTNAKEILEHHWDTWITEPDWLWLSEHGINTVRIPVGFYHVCGAERSVLEGTSFADLENVFSGAWTRILNAIDSASRLGIGVLIDLHAAAGKQNADAHSGQTGSVHFFERKNMIRTQHALWVLARELHEKNNVVGIQLLNEPQDHHALAEWYTTTLDELRRIAPTLPLYIHDAWDTDKYAAFAGARAESDFVVVDHHLYRCFTSSDQALSGDEHANVLRTHMDGELAARASACRGNIVIAEFSAALNPASLRSDEAGEQDRQRRVFARAELGIFERHCAGWYFWTYKKDSWDAGWSLRDTIVAEIMPSWFGIRKVSGAEIADDPAGRDMAKEKALHEHTAYWDQYQGHYEHWRFEEGFTRGWDDAYEFFSFDLGSSISELGFKGQWAKRRAFTHAKEKGHSGNIWEFEHGLSQGIDAARKALEEIY